MESTVQSAATADDIPDGRSFRVTLIFDGFVFATFLPVILRAWVPSSTVGWPEALFVVALTVSTLAALSRELPLQNVLLAAVVMGLIAGATSVIGKLTGLPFVPARYADAMGPRLFRVLPWAMPLVWMVMILTARGVSRLIMRPWRGSAVYGYRLFGLTAGLAVILELGVQVFAQTMRCWSWKPGNEFSGAPFSHYLWWLVTVLVILVLATPVLIRKQPGESPPSWHPLIVWVALNLLFAAAALADALWLAAGCCFLLSIAVPLLALLSQRS